MNRLALFIAADLAALLLAAGTASAAYQFDGTSWGQPGTADGEFASPGSIAVGLDGSVYVADTGNQRIQKFTGDGAFQTSWGTAGAATSQFNRRARSAASSRMG